MNIAGERLTCDSLDVSIVQAPIRGFHVYWTLWSPDKTKVLATSWIRLITTTNMQLQF